MKSKIKNIEIKNQKMEEELKSIFEIIKNNKNDIKNDSKNLNIIKENINQQAIYSNRMKEDYKRYYEIVEKIGRGTFGTVYKVKDKVTKEFRALKIIDLPEFDEDEKELNIKNLMNSIKIMELCSNKTINSIKYYEYFLNENEFAIIIELCDDNLLKLIKRRRIGFNDIEIKQIMTQLNNAFQILKENNIIHRDIKLENILIKYEDYERKDFIVKLTDYDFSRHLLSNSICGTYPGTPLTMAPEVLEGEKYDNKCDLWSIGIIIYQLYFKEVPYNGNTEVALLNKIKNFKRTCLRNTNNSKLNDLIRRLLIDNPKERITWEEYFNHSFFN